jgi:non-lysosomal glucosylceramidase
MKSQRRFVSALLGTLALTAGLLAVSTPPVSAADLTGPTTWNFEDGTQQGWTAQPGSQFGPLITDRVYYHNNPGQEWNKEGTYFLSTEEDPQGNYNDSYTGVIDSPSFTLTRPDITLLIDGGNLPQTYVAACLPDATATNGCRVLAKTQGNDAEPFLYRTLDLSAYVGQTLFLQLVDESTGGWGHLTIDDVRVNYPSVPTGVTADRSDTAVSLRWNAVREAGLKGYDVYRSVNETSGYTRITTQPTTATSYTDRSTTPSTGYFYRVVSVLSDGSRGEGPNTAYAGPYQDPFARGSTVTYTGDQRSGIEFPVGPLGAGGILHFGDGTRNESWIFNHDDTFRDRDTGTVPNSFFAVRAVNDKGQPVVRALQTSGEGAFPGMRDLSFQGEYPMAHYRFDDSALPVQVSEDVTNPTIPGSLKDSAIPTALYTFTLKNPTKQPMSVSLMATQQNAVGFDGVGTIGGPTSDLNAGFVNNTNALTLGAQQGRLLMSGTPDNYGNSAAVDPDPTGPKLALSMLASNVTGSASWSGLDKLYADFSDDGAASGPASATSPSPGTTVDGALSTTLRLKPGAEVKIPVVLSWNFPANPVRNFGGEGEQYTNWWPNAAAVDGYTVTHLTSLLKQTQQFHDTVYRSNLPQYVLDRLTSGISVLHTPSVFWARNGFFGGWEGYGCCWGMPNHVWEYAQTASALWPQVGQMWAQQWLDAEKPDGLLPYRYDTGSDSYGVAFDGQAGVILSAYRTYEQTGDTAWLKRYWGKIQGAMNYLVTANDPDRDGILTGAQYTTLDSSESGTGSWLGSLYLAAVNATAQMAHLAGDGAANSRYQTLYGTGRANQEKLLWNGDYYQEKPQNLPGTVAYGPGSDIDMLLGQWWSTQLGLGDIYDSGHMDTAARNLFANNFQTSFVSGPPEGRDYVEPTDAGMKNTTWPQGGKPANPLLYYDETWTGTEYSSAALMIQRGDVADGLRVVQAAADRYDGRLRDDLALGGCAAGDGAGNPFGDVECGQWYSRSMSGWSVLTALQGFSYNGATHDLGFEPQWQPDDHSSFFTTGTSYGTLSQRVHGADQVDTIQVSAGSLRLDQVHLAVGSHGVRQIRVSVDHHPVEAHWSATAGGLSVELPASTVRAGTALSITVTLAH